MSKNSLNPLKNLKSDIPASIVVFLVALPLCLGIALASGAPPISGVIAGIIGGIVVGSLSGSPLGVSGPAAGLAVIVLNAIETLGSFEIFLVAVVIAGILQVLMGLLKAGIIAYYFPSSVIHGMLAGIGILIFFKEIPHAFGVDKDPDGDYEFFQSDNQNTISELWNMVDYVDFHIMIISAVCLFLLILWQTKWIKKNKILSMIPGPLLAVIAGITINFIYSKNPDTIIDASHLVSLPIVKSSKDFLGLLTFPDLSAFKNYNVYTTAVIIAVVASLETLLSVEAIDKQDELKRVTPTNRELLAQGAGNILSGLIGGIPVTQVIVRSSANQQSGGKTKASAIIHGFLLLICLLTIAPFLNMIPRAALASVLLVIGFKLASPVLFKRMYKQGREQFIPFLVTVVVIFFTDLLIGISAGLIVAIFIILKNNYRVPFNLKVDKSKENFKVTFALSEDVTFLNKAAVLRTLKDIPDNSHLVVDASRTHFIHHDIVEIFQDFEINAKSRNITVEFIELTETKEVRTLYPLKK